MAVVMAVAMAVAVARAVAVAVARAGVEAQAEGKGEEGGRGGGGTSAMRSPSASPSFAPSPRSGCSRPLAQTSKISVCMAADALSVMPREARTARSCSEVTGFASITAERSAF